MWGSIALFAVLFALLTYQLSAASTPAPQQVLVRKVIKRRVVTTIAPEPAAGSTAGPVVTSSAPEVSSSGSAPVTTSAS
jgi:hypothetical protein